MTPPVCNWPRCGVRSKVAGTCPCKGLQVVPEPDDSDDPNPPETFRGVEWEPGDLSQNDLRRVIRDAAAELWVDSYRRGDLSPTARERRYREVIAAELYAATGVSWSLRRV